MRLLFCDSRGRAASAAIASLHGPGGGRRSGQDSATVFLDHSASPAPATQEARNPADGNEDDATLGLSTYLTAMLLALWVTVQLMFAVTLLAPGPDDALARWAATTLSGPGAQPGIADDRTLPPRDGPVNSDNSRDCTSDSPRGVNCVRE